MRYIILGLSVFLISCTSAVDTDFQSVRNSRGCAQTIRSGSEFLDKHSGVKDKKVGMVAGAVERCLKEASAGLRTEDQYTAFISEHKGNKWAADYVQKAEKNLSDLRIYNEFMEAYRMKDIELKYRAYKSFIEKHRANQFAAGRNKVAQFPNGLIDEANEGILDLSRKIGEKKYLPIDKLYQLLQIDGRFSLQEKEEFKRKYVNNIALFQFYGDVRRVDGKIEMGLIDKMTATFAGDPDTLVSLKGPEVRARCYMKLLSPEEKLFFAYPPKFRLENCEIIEAVRSGGDFKEDTDGRW